MLKLGFKFWQYQPLGSVEAFVLSNVAGCTTKANFRFVLGASYSMMYMEDSESHSY